MRILLIVILFFITSNLSAQTKKVLFEEFTGTGCGNCPEGHYKMDNLMNTYPNLIGVGLHTYNSNDAMFFPEIDTIGQAYAPGAPMAGTDRIFSGSWVAQIWTTWESDIQTRLAESPKLSVSLDVTWSSSSRLISAIITCDMLQNLPNGDYRFNLYVVEDSVTGIGSGYDQTSFYDSNSSLPFFGLGNPIVGYVHRHVARAILPNSWGQGGIISSSPLTGESFSTTINYTLPASYDEQKIELVAFISKYTSNHQGDEVYNAEKAPLIDETVGIATLSQEAGFEVYPNPSDGTVYLDGKTNGKIILYNSTGKTVMTIDLKKGTNSIDLSSLPKGIYYANMITKSSSTTRKIILN
tara:strand:+ start:82 stop:1140 length:1059 start_codon:yes stop_codon:yes gene_type:complete